MKFRDCLKIGLKAGTLFVGVGVFYSVMNYDSVINMYKGSNRFRHKSSELEKKMNEVPMTQPYQGRDDYREV